MNGTNQPQRITVDTRTIIRFCLVIVGFIAAIAAIFFAKQALLIVGTALFLALVLNVPVTQLAKRLPGRSRVGATAIAYVAVLVILGAILTLVVPPIVKQTAQFIQNVPTIVDNAGEQWKGVNNLIQQYNLQPQVDQAVNSLKESTASWASNVGQTVISGVGSIFSFLGSLILVLILTFFMLIEAPEWMKRIWGLYENRTRMNDHKRIISRLYGIINAYVTGQLTVSAIGATFAGCAVFVIGLIFHIPLNLALPTAAITFVMSLIPMFGATIGAVIIGLLLLMNSIPAAITYIIYFVIYQQIENSFVSPHIQSKKIDLSPLAILTAVTTGLYLFGLAGGIIAIPIAGCIRILLEEYLEYAKKKRQSRTPLKKAA
jgi:predicted PurR-regulated permease PerM